MKWELLYFQFEKKKQPTNQPHNNLEKCNIENLIQYRKEKYIRYILRA